MKFYDRFAEQRWEEHVSSVCTTDMRDDLQKAVQWASKMEEVLFLKEEVPPNLSDRLPPPDGTCYAARAALDVGMKEVSRKSFDYIVRVLSETWLFGGRLTSNLYTMEHGWTTVAELVWKDFEAIPKESLGEMLRKRGGTISPWVRKTFAKIGRDVYHRQRTLPGAADIETDFAASAAASTTTQPGIFVGQVFLYSLLEDPRYNRTLVFEGDSLEDVQRQIDECLADHEILPTKKNTVMMLLPDEVWQDPEKTRKKVGKMLERGMSSDQFFWTTGTYDNTSVVFLDGTEGVAQDYPIYDFKMRPTGLRRSDVFLEPFPPF